VVFNWQVKRCCFWVRLEVSLPLLFCVRVQRAAIQKWLCLCNFVFFGSLGLNILALKALYIIPSLIHTLTFIFCAFECLFFYPVRIIVCIFSETVSIEVSEKFWKSVCAYRIWLEYCDWYLFHTSSHTFYLHLKVREVQVTVTNLFCHVLETAAKPNLPWLQ
jgi:hypothetical protein